MTTSLWHAHGNEYLVAEGDYDMGGDGALEVERVDGDDVWITIRNTDGSVAEMSGNGTRIAGAWLMERTGSDVARVHVGPLTVEVRRAGDLYESAMGEVQVFPREQAIEAIVARTRRYAAYQRKWMRRIPGLVIVEDADDDVALARTRERVPRCGG